ncbi:MAG: hypothetical protein JXQ75_17845, partial [Phycisphaerae bacterium]|nr:hypothetical protein [Phycisphaerae bacterium]
SMAQWRTQDVPLTPGWNAIYLEVAPEPSECAQIFKNRQVESVWMWNKRFSTIDYDIDPNTLLPDDPHWLVWFPESNPESFLTRLINMSGSAAYLVKLPTNAAPYALSIKGRAEVPYFEWFPHALNLVGLPVNPDNEPTFMDFFRHTPSIDTTKGYHNELYKLDSDGEGTRIVSPAREDIEHGVAYWIKCSTAPKYTAPVHVDAPNLYGLDFGTVLTEQDLSIINPSDTDSITASVQQVSSEDPPAGLGFPERAGDVPLSYFVYEPSGPSWEWEDLSVGETLTRSLAPGEEWLIRFAVRRADFPPYTPVGTNGASYQSLLKVSGFGNTVLYHVGVEAEEGALLLGAPSESQHVNKGLWVGETMLYKVNCPAYSPTNLLLTDSLCEFRLLVHVDDGGQARLLQEVFMAWVPLSETNGEYRLYASRSSLPGDAEDVSRISSVAFPLMGPVLLAGAMSNTLTGTVTVDCNDPVNPFLHRYHPLHDNKDWDGNVYTNPVETLTVSRDITMDFTTGVSTNAEEHPLWGVSVVGGTYHETLTGLREQVIEVEGSFELNRISELHWLY